MSHSRSKRILGMTYLQAGILAALALALVALFSCFTVVVLVNNSFESGTPTPSTKYPPSLSGLTQDSVASYLRHVGVSCNPVEPNEPYGYLAFCSGASASGLTEVSVEVSSRDENDYVYLIVAVLHQNSGYSSQTANQILGAIAAIPYTNADPAGASSWVRNNLSANGKPIETFGGIQFELSCNFAEPSKCLAIGQEAQAP